MKNNGITLIALVVTIVILLILATVSINLVFNENGIITRAKDTKQISELDSDKEKIYQIYNINKIDGKEINEENLKNTINQEYGENVNVYTGENSQVIHFINSGKIYKIDDAGNIEEIKNIDKILESEIKKGDYIDYKAGKWTLNEINELENKKLYSGKQIPTVGNEYKFGGYEVGDSKDEAVNNNEFNGWRVLEIKNDTIKIISEGVLESYFQPLESKSAYKTTYILRGAGEENYGQMYNKRTWNEYENKRFVQEGTAHCMNWDEIYALSLEDDLRKSNDIYWIPIWKYNDNNLTCITKNGEVSFANRVSYGIRIVLTLKSDLIVSKENENYKNTGYSLWNIYE